MSSVFPTVPGFAGPFSLKEFLHRYFFLHLRFDSRAPVSAAPTPPAAVPELLLRPIGTFTVVVYVSLSAPPPPPLPLTLSSPLSLSFSLPAACRAPLSRPVTAAVLRHPFWAALFARVGPAAAAFMAAWCPTAVQFAPAGGGLQVMGPPLKSAAAKRRRGREAEEPRKRARHENERSRRPGRTAASSAAALYGVHVSCRAVIGEAPARTPAEIGEHTAETIVDDIWHRRLASDADISVAADNLVPLVFSYSLPPQNEGDKGINGSSVVKEHLSRILHCVLCSVRRMNLRGAAIKHTGFIESRILGEADPDVSTFLVSESILASYIRTLLAEMRWVNGPFWGDGPVLVQLSSIVRDWLRGGRHGVFPLSYFLHGIPVARLPWLRGFYTAGSTGPQRRSMVQQRVFLQLIFFLSQHIVPRLVRRSFHVTWSLKTPNTFVYIPISVWYRLVRRELRRVSVRRRPRRPLRQLQLFARHVEESGESRDPKETDGSGRARAVRMPFPRPMLLEPIASRDAVWAKAAEQSVARVASDGSPLVLHSSIRFLPNGRKLRPIALIRLARAGALARMAAGPPRPRVLPRARLSSSGLAAPRPNATLLRQALRCLLAGAEEERAAAGLTRRSNASHQDEYAELRAFVEAARQFCAHPLLSPEIVPGTAAPGQPVVEMLRGDAARCYDRLPQDLVMAAVERLVPHEQYYTLRLTVIAPVTAAASTSINSIGYRYKRVYWDTDADGCSSESVGERLVMTVRLQTVSLQDIKAGVLPGIPRGSIVWEEPLAHSAALRGADVRGVLAQHLRNHLVLVNGRLYAQRTGIAQGSAVAMLLCDTLLARVDAALADILAEHEEPALLMRRVDDILIVTLSRAAADHCHAALSRGWPDAGYVCQEAKLRRSTSAPVPWCGLLWDPCTLEMSVEWARLGALRSRLAVRQRTGGELLRSATRLVEIMTLRVPFTAVCRRINTRPRVVQTIYEMGLVWARLLLQKFIANAAFVRPHIPTLMRPLFVTIAMLQRLLRRQTSTLTRLGSFCDVTGNDVRICLIIALHRTLQCRLRCMLVRSAHCKRFRDILPLFAAIITKRAEMAIAEADASCGGVTSETTAALLTEEGPGSLSSRALAAVQGI